MPAEREEERVEEEEDDGEWRERSLCLLLPLLCLLPCLSRLLDFRSFLSRRLLPPPTVDSLSRPSTRDETPLG